ncbi:MAG TPA: class I SAM-dependent methyltransferase [Opitutaceae bacterium]|jgi:ubiquinone/menaquinone biosynthesis C-methylase UbiE
MPFAPGAFLGTAEFYVKYRPSYPRILTSDLLERAGIGPDANLLDLACGTGRVALSIADAFQEVWAVDLEPEMLAAARQLDAKRSNPFPPIHWVQADADSFYPPESVSLITIGDAFHRLDQARVIENAMRVLTPGGVLATLGSYTFMGGPEPWQQLVSKLMDEFTGRNISGAERPPPDTHPNAEVFRSAGFSEVANYSFDVLQSWTPDTLVGFLKSTSVCSRRTLGSRADEFESRLRRMLASQEPTGIFREVACFGYTFGRKPA